MTDEKEPNARQRDDKGRLLPGHHIGHKWQPGESGNPKGGPKKELSLTMKAREMIEKDPSILEGIVRAWLEQGKTGDRDARRDLLDRFEGKVTQPIVTDGEIVIRVVYEDE